MQRIRDRLEQLGADSGEIAAVDRAPSDVEEFWTGCGDPLLMMRVAGAVGVDARLSVAIALDVAGAVLQYIGDEELRPRAAVGRARESLENKCPAEDCLAAAEAAEAAGDAYRDARHSGEQPRRRAYRTAAYACYAAAGAARTAHTAALIAELDFDSDYTTADAWEGAAEACATLARQAIHDAMEAVVSATATRISEKTGSDLAGRAAAHEARAEVQTWGADLLRVRITKATLRAAADAV